MREGKEMRILVWFHEYSSTLLFSLNAPNFWFLSNWTPTHVFSHFDPNTPNFNLNQGYYNHMVSNQIRKMKSKIDSYPELIPVPRIITQ